MDRPSSAPPVVAVIVAREPGPWFEEALASFGAQDYPNLSVLIVDGGANGEPTRRVAQVLPEAYVRRVDGVTTFAELANDALQTVQGAAFLAFSHDDVAPDPDAIRRMVEEAFRSNAAVVAPKVVEWDRPERLLDVGLMVDKTGTTAPIADRGELDQEQHDAVRDVFSVTTTCMLVRSDLFTALGGFDAQMGNWGVDVDFCWRAQIAGGRVLVAPSARVRHKLGGHEGDPPDEEHLNLDRRYHLRSMLKSYSRLHLLRVVPQAFLVTFVEMVLALFGRRWSELRHLPQAWMWNLRHSGDLRRERRSIQKARAVPDSDVRRLQVRGSVRLTNYLRRRLHADDRAEAFVAAGQRFAGSLGRGPGQAAAVLLAVLALAIFAGSRHLIWGRIPAVGELAPFPKASTMLTTWLSGWRFTGIGSTAPAPTLIGALGIAGVIFLGKVALLQKVLILAAWPLAGWGVWRLGRPMRSTLARLVAVAGYLAVPLSYNSVARGRWDGLVAWAALPWLLAIVARASGLAPFGPDPDESGPLPATLARAQAIKLGIAIAIAGAVVPSIAIALGVMAVGMLLGSLVAGGVSGSTRALGAVFWGTVVALALHLPWSIDLLMPGGWASVVGVGPSASRAPSFASLLRFDIGPMGAGPLGFVFLIAAALPLAIGRSWRLAWAIRLWAGALTCVVVAWAGARGWVPLRLEAPDVLLAPAALGIAFAAALGAAAFERDLSRFRFGWRQLASLAAGGALGLGVLPVAAGVRDGRWGLTSDDVARSVSWMTPEARTGAFRVLWLGDPQALPLDGWRVADGLAYATSRNGPPSATDNLPGSPSPATDAIADSLRLAERGDTARLGRLLAPMAIRYIVVPIELATGATKPGAYPVPDLVGRALVSQVDLRALPSDPGVAVYENTSWGPGRSQLPDRLTGPIPKSLGPGVDLGGSTAVLPSGGPTRYTGPVSDDNTLLLAEAPSGRWSLTIGGHSMARQTAYGVANAYRPDRQGKAVLRYRTPILRYGLLLLQLALWVFAVRSLVALRTRARELAA